MFGNMRVNVNEEKQKMFPFFFKSASIFRMLFSLKKGGNILYVSYADNFFVADGKKKTSGLFYAENKKDYGKYGIDIKDIL